MLKDRASPADEDRADRPPSGRRFSIWLIGACVCAQALGQSVAEAQLRPHIVPPQTVHPAFAAKLKDRRAFRAANWVQEDTCPGTGDLQHVRDYDGTLGQPRAFIDAHKDPVGRFETDGLCSGTLIARNLFLTASHCVDDLTVLSDTVTFNFEKLAASSGTAETTSFRIARLVQDGADADLDFAILELQAAPGDTFGVTPLEEFMPAVSHLITIIQHPGGERKQVEVGHVHSHTSDTIRYDDLDTQPGSSGSGVLDARGHLVGVHTNGGCTDGGENTGIRMDRIAARSETIRGLLPPTRLARESRIRLLRAHDVGTGYGPPGDAIDAEAVVLLESTDDESYGFNLRSGTDGATHRSMFSTLRDAFRENVAVRIEFDRETHGTNRIVRVIRK